MDGGFEALSRIIEIVNTTAKNIETEEEAKIQIINRVIIECLGWKQPNISAERKNLNGYSDYILKDSVEGEHDKRYFLIEAKKYGLLNLKSQTQKMQAFKVSGPALKEFFDAISQAASYCAPLGIQLAVVSDGITWVIFQPIVLDYEYTERKALVFPNLDAVKADFATFYELLSAENCKKKTFKIIFDKIHENRLVQEHALHAAIPAFDIHLNQKSSLAFDLEGIYSFFFSTLSGEDDPELEVNCFVESRESRVADFALEKMAAHVLGNIAPTTNGIDAELSALISGTFEVDQGQTVFVVSPTGSGKSTFLKRFFKKILPRPVRDQCVVMNVNALDATGDDQTSISWLTEELIKILEASAFKGKNASYNELLALYHLEYVKRAEGLYIDLYNKDKEAFKDKFTIYMEEQIEKDREGYLRRLLTDTVVNRMKLPIIIVDNTDEFSLTYKEKIFQYCQSLKRIVKFSIIIFPITDKSAWMFSKTEIFNIYSSKSFFLPTPPPREVFRKRIDYLKEKIALQAQVKQSAEYGTLNGIKISIKNLSAFASILENIFVDEENTSKRVGELSNYNIRKTLKLSKRIITSAYLNVDDLIKSFLTGDKTPISFGRFTMALLLGDYNHYKREDEHNVFSLFQVSDTIRQTPLIYLRILSHLRDFHIGANNDAGRYVTVSSICRYFDLLNLTEASVDIALQDMIEFGIVERYDLSEKEYNNSLKIAITYSGLAHLELALHNRPYFEEMALTTAIPNPEVAKEICANYFSKNAFAERMAIVKNLFVEHLLSEDASIVTIPSDNQFAGQRNLTETLSRAYRSSKTPFEKDGSQEGISGTIYEGTIGTIDFFNREKWFGKVTIDKTGETAHLNGAVLEKFGAPTVYALDDILCDVSANERGLFVSQIHEIHTPPAEHLDVEIVRLFQDRAYGFVRVKKLGVDAYFDLNLIEISQRAALVVGGELSVQVRRDKNGQHQVVRVF